jgi:hypothetical protein
MSSLTWNQLIDSSRSELSIPEITSKMSIREAALSYAAAGWYVLPVNQKTKNPGSYVGVNWPEQSSRDPERINSWFKFDGLSIALHIGKSGAVVFDVDNPDALPSLIAAESERLHAPFQSTRMLGDGRRGHHVFRTPPGMTFGNSLGPFDNGFGDIRGKNGVIIVAPSVHSKSDNFGHYVWKVTGPVPELPLSIALQLPQISSESFSALNRAESREFIFVNSENKYPELLKRRFTYFRANPPAINTRHQSFQRFLCLVLKDAVVGMYPAALALTESEKLFDSIKPQADQTDGEFERMACWAMAQVSAMTEDEILMHSLNVAPHLSSDIMKWVNRHVR